MTDSATYLYVDGKRYWYSTQPTVTRLADDRASQLSDEQISDEIIKTPARGGPHRGAISPKFTRAYPAATSRTNKEARLVILGPDFPHANKDEKSAARREAAAILESRGSSPRNYKNTLVFVAADAKPAPRA